MNPQENIQTTNQHFETPIELSLLEGSSKIDRAKQEITKATTMVGGVVKAFFKESWEQISEGRTLTEKAKIGAAVGGVALFAAGGQIADRFRLPESLNIPNAIEVAKNHGNPAGAAALGLGVYATQFAIGSAWGLGLNRFRKTANVFDEAYPGYKDTIAEENAGYLKTLWRQSVIGLGIGNTLFVAAEVLDDQEMSNLGVAKTSNRSAKRIGVAAASLGFGILTAAEANYDRNILWWSVPDVVDRLEQPSSWIAFGVGIEVASHVVGTIFKTTKAIITKPSEVKISETIEIPTVSTQSLFDRP